MITSQPYYFYRSYQKDEYKDLVVIGLDVHKGKKAIDVSKFYKDGDTIRDAYSDTTTKVSDGKVLIDSEFDIVLLEKI